MNPRIIIAIAVAVIAMIALYVFVGNSPPASDSVPGIDAGPSARSNNTPSKNLPDTPVDAGGAAQPTSPRAPADIPLDPAAMVSPDAGKIPLPIEPSAALSPDAGLDGGPAPGSSDGGAPVATNPEKPSGTLSREAIQDAIKEMRPQIKKCYETLLGDFPEADGKVTLKFAIAADNEGIGRVDLEKVAEDSSLYDRSLNECMIESLRSLEFPAPEGGGEVRVTYPFKFARAPEPDAGQAP